MDKRKTNRELMESMKKTLLNEGANKRYYQKHVDKFLNDLQEFQMEFSNDDEIGEVQQKWIFGHIERAKISLEKLEKTVGKLK